MQKVILLGLFALTVMVNSNAQTSCATAVDAVMGTNQAPAQAELWYKFSPSGQALAQYYISYDSKSLDVEVEVFSGSCNDLNVVSEKSRYGQIPAIPNDNNTYYIHFIWNGTPQAFSWELSQNVIIPMTGIDVTPETINLTLGESFRINDKFAINRLPENTTEYPMYEYVVLNYKGIISPAGNYWAEVANGGAYVYDNTELEVVGTGAVKIAFIALKFENNIPVSLGTDTVTINIAAPLLCNSATTITAGANTAQTVQEQWFHFTATKTGIYTISHEDVTPSGDKISVDWNIYEGDCNHLRLIPQVTWRQFQAEAGKTYSLKLYQYYQYGLAAFDWTLDEPVSVTGFSLTTKELELTLSNHENVDYELRNLGLNFTPDDATDKGVDIAVRDTSIVSLWEDGQAIVYKDIVRPVKEGSTWLVFTTHDGGFRDSCQIRVKRVAVTSLTLSKHEQTLWLPYNFAGESIAIDSLGLRINPDNATDKSYRITVRNKAIVKYQSGYLQANREGSTYVIFTANDGGLQDSLLVNVTRTVTGGVPCDTAAVAQLGNNAMPAAEYYTKWFTFTPAESGNYALSIVVEKYPFTEVEVYEGNCSALHLINDDRLLGGHYEVDHYGAGFYGETGKTYYLKLTTLYYNTEGGGTIVPYTWTIAKISAGISGTVTDNDSPAQGKVELYVYSGQNTLTFKQRTDIQTDGSYLFGDLGVEDYIVKAITPNGDFAYYGNTMKWTDANIIHPNKSDTLTGNDITITHQTPLDEGSAKISGYVFSSENVQRQMIRRVAGLHSSGNPVAHIAVLLQRSGTTIAYTQTDGEGYFEFTGVGTGEYAVVVDIPGLEMEEPTTVSITNNTQTVELGYEVSEAGIEETTETAVATVETSGLGIYPNPVSDILSITGAENATLTVLNLQGQTVYAKHKLSVTENIPVISWAKGVYLIILQTGNNRIVNKIIKK